MKKSLAIFVFAVLVLVAAVAVPRAYALGTVQFTPASLSLNAGDSVVGDGLLVPGLTIAQSGGDDVMYIKAGEGPGAYGAPNTSSAISNGCLVKGAGIVDKSPDGPTTSRKHHYVFTFGNATISEFNASIADFGDFMPFGVCTDNRCSILMKAFDASNTQVAGDEVFFTTDSANINGRISTEYGDMDTAGDACSATAGQPGNSSLTVSGSGITRVEIMFESHEDMDPNMAISDLSFTPEVKEDVTPTPTPTPGDEVTPTPTPTGDPEATPSATPTQDPTPTPTPGQSSNGGGSNNGGNSNTGGSSSNTSANSTPAKEDGQVLGASTYAATGVADDIAANVVGVMGLISFTAGIIKAKRKTK
jgi:hypothetical protein